MNKEGINQKTKNIKQKHIEWLQNPPDPHRWCKTSQMVPSSRPKNQQKELWEKPKSDTASPYECQGSPCNNPLYHRCSAPSMEGWNPKNRVTETLTDYVIVEASSIEKNIYSNAPCAKWGRFIFSKSWDDFCFANRHWGEFWFRGLTNWPTC